MAQDETTRKSAAEKRADKENPTGDDVKREDVKLEATKGVKEPVDPEQAPKEPVGGAGDPDVAKQEEERLEAAEDQLERTDKKNLLDAERSLHKRAMKDGLKAVESSVDTADHEQVRLTEQREAVDRQHEALKEKLGPRRVDGAVGSMEKVELELEPTDPAQRRFTINVIVHGEVDDAYLIIRTTDEERVAPDYKEGQVYESPRFGTKNRIRAIAGDKPGEIAGEYTDLGKFQTTPMRLAPGNYEVTLETVGGKKVASETFVLLGDAVDARGQPVPEDSPAIRGMAMADDAEEAHRRQQLDVTGKVFLEEEVGRQQKRAAKQVRTAKAGAAKE